MTNGLNKLIKELINSKKAVLIKKRLYNKLKIVDKNCR